MGYVARGSLLLLHSNSCHLLLLLICGEYSGLMALIRLVCGVYLVGTWVGYAGSP
jgi:hypothetical protein